MMLRERAFARGPQTFWRARVILMLDAIFSELSDSYLQMSSSQWWYIWRTFGDFLDSILMESWSAWEEWLLEFELNLHRWQPSDARSRDRWLHPSLSLTFSWCDEPWCWGHLMLSEAEHTWGSCRLSWVWAPLYFSFLEFWFHPWFSRLLYPDHLRPERLMWFPRALYFCPWSLRRALRELPQWKPSLWWRLCDQWLPEKLAQTPDSLWLTRKWAPLWPFNIWRFDTIEWRRWWKSGIEFGIIAEHLDVRLFLDLWGP